MNVDDREHHRLADRRREVGGQSGRHDGGTLRAAGRGGHAAVAGRRLRPNAASGYLRPQFHLEARRAEVDVGTVDFDILDTPEFNASPLTIVFREGSGGQGPRRRSRQPAISRSSTTCARKASPTISRCRCCSSTAPHASSWTTKQPGGFTDEQLAALRIDRAAADAADRNHQPSPHRRHAARHLCRQPRRRTDHGRPDQARPRRDHACRDLAVGLARFYRAVRPAAGRDRGRHPQSLFRLPGRRDPGPWRRGAEISWATDCSRCFRSTNMSATPRRSAPACWKPRANPAPASRHALPGRRHRRTLPLRRRAACRATFSTAISAAATGSTSPASVPPSIWRRGWKRSPAGLTARWSRRTGFAGICRGGWSDLGEFPIAGFSKAERVYGLIG